MPGFPILKFQLINDHVGKLSIPHRTGILCSTPHTSSRFILYTTEPHHALLELLDDLPKRTVAKTAVPVPSQKGSYAAPISLRPDAFEHICSIHIRNRPAAVTFHGRTQLDTRQEKSSNVLWRSMERVKFAQQRCRNMHKTLGLFATQTSSSPVRQSTRGTNSLDTLMMAAR